MRDLLRESGFDAGGNAVPGAEYTHFGGIELVAPIGTNDLNLDSVVNSWAQGGLTHSLFIEDNFSRRSSCNARSDVHAARKMRRHA